MIAPTDGSSCLLLSDGLGSSPFWWQPEQETPQARLKWDSLDALFVRVARTISLFRPVLTSRPEISMSALPPKADILRCSEECRLFDNLVGGHKQHRCHSQPELLVCRRRLTNSFFLKDRCSVSDQISLILASNWRGLSLL